MQFKGMEVNVFTAGGWQSRSREDEMGAIYGPISAAGCSHAVPSQRFSQMFRDLEFGD